MRQFYQKFDFSDLEELEREFGLINVTRATTSATNRVTRKVRTKIRLAVRKRYNVKAAAITRRVKTTNATYTKPDAALVYIGSRIGLVNFSAKKKVVRGVNRRGKKFKARGATVKVLRNDPRKLVKSMPGFIAVGKSGNLHVFARTTEKRNSLVALKSLSIPQMVGSETVLKEIDRTARTEFPVEFDRAMDYFTSKLK